MEKYKYGPLEYITKGMDDDEGNYYWNGLPPVGYDKVGIPIDQNGNQCLDISCPLHPSWEPYEAEYSGVLAYNIPTINHFRHWFDENFLEISDEQTKRYILKWWHARALTSTPFYAELLKKYSSVEEIMEAVWPDEQQS